MLQDKNFVMDFKGSALHALSCRAALPGTSEGLRLLLLLPVQSHDWIPLRAAVRVVAFDASGCAGEVEKKSYTVLAPGGTYAHIYNE